MDYVLVAGGFVFLFIGGESLVRGAVGLAQRFDVSPLFSGIVVVALGTSAPEFVVCLQAALRGHYDITVGNIVGSNIANILLILAVAALIQPVICRRSILRLDGSAMLLASLVLVGLAMAGEVSRWAGFAMLGLLGAYIAVSYRQERNASAPEQQPHAREVEEIDRLPRTLWLGLLASVVGAGFLVAGAEMLIEGATGIALAAGIPEAVIGVTLVAVGTSLPELATAIVAAVRKHADVALGNVLGSNVFNVLGMLGLTAVIAPVTVAEEFLRIDVWVMLASALVLIVLLIAGVQLRRGVAGALLAAYAGYVMILFASVPPI